MKRFILLTLLWSCFSVFAEPEMSASEVKVFVKNAITYALENKNPKMDYGKYVSPNFVNRVDGNVFNFNQWVTHQKHIKAITQSMKPRFDWIVAEGNNVAVIFYIDLVKKDGRLLTVKDMAFFKIQNHKVIYVEELTRLVKGALKDKNIGSTQ